MATLELDLITVKGKTKPVRIHTLLGDNELAKNADFKAFSEKFLKMLDSYRSKDFKEAEATLAQAKELCKKLPKIHIDGLFDLYAERIETFIKSPPPEGWDGAFVATSK